MMELGKITLNQEQVFDYALLYDECFIDIHKTMERPPIALGIGYHYYKDKQYLNPTLTYGEMSAIVAPQKNKKTFFKAALAASYIGGKATEHFPGMVTCRSGKKYILDFDTEQGKYYAQRAFKTVMEMVGDHYDNYLPFGLKTLTDDERVKFIDAVIEEHKGEVGIVFIDGIADLCMNTNDIEKSKKVLQKMIDWTGMGLHLCGVIHKTFEKDKATGHLGTFMQKKAETTIFLRTTDKDTNNSPVEVIQKDSRGAPFDKFYFNLDLKTLLPKECEPEQW